jgi:hypothetical protein
VKGGNAVGTDIYIIPERLRDGRWEYIDVGLDDFVDYDVFAVLADVRNGRAAGAVTGDGYNPISTPRGFPVDISRETRSHFGLGPDDNPNHALGDGEFHTPTWLRLDEILDYDWNRTTRQRGVLPESEWESYKVLGKPRDGYACGFLGPGRVTLTTAQMRDLKEGRLQRDPSRSYYFELWWTTTYWEGCGWFVEMLKERLSAFGSPDRIRLIIFFDS